MATRCPSVCAHRVCELRCFHAFVRAFVKPLMLCSGALAGPFPDCTPSIFV